jgi:N-acetylneuraminic acid mutarotase
MSKHAAQLLILTLFIPLLIMPAKPVSAASSGTWTSRAPMQVARAGVGVAVVSSKIYAIGGSTRSGGGGTRDGPLPFTGGVVGTNEEYDPATDTWTYKAPMPTARDVFGIAVYDDKIYCVGGSTEKGSGVKGLNEVYDPATDSWETKAPMPTDRSYLKANVVNGKIYLVGGYVSDSSISNLNEVYDPETDSWTNATSMPVATADYPSAVVGHKIYFIGGLSSSPQSYLNQIYDAETDAWTEGKSVPSGIWYGAAGATTGVNALKRIYLFSCDMNLVCMTQVYNPDLDRWGGMGATMPTNRLGFAVAVAYDMIYVLGGYNMSYLDPPLGYAYGPAITVLGTNEQFTPFNYGVPDPSYDGTPPAITVDSPENKTYYAVDVALNFTVNETAPIMYYILDGEAAVKITGNTTLTGLSLGTHNLRVYAVDASDNTGSSKTITFTLVQEPEPEPFPTTLVIGSIIAVVAVVGLGLLVYLKKRK